MSPEAGEELSRLFDFVEAGKLPKSAIPRLFYCGHELLHGTAPEKHEYMCASCQSKFGPQDLIEENEGFEKWLTNYTCPNCKQKDTIYNITEEAPSKWRCRECKYEFLEHNGTVCPKCKAVSNL